MSRVDFQLPVDLDEVITTAKVECVQEVETHKLKVLLEWIVDRVKGHALHTETIEERIAGLEEWKRTDPVKGVWDEVQTLKDKQVRCSTELQTQTGALSKLTTSVESLHTKLEMVEACAVEEARITSESELPLADGRDGRVQEQVCLIEDKLKEAESQKPASSVELPHETTLAVTTDSNSESKIKNEKEDGECQDSSLDMAQNMERLSGRLEDVEYQLQLIQEQTGKQPFSSASTFQTQSNTLEANDKPSLVLPEFSDEKASCEEEQCVYTEDTADAINEDPIKDRCTTETEVSETNATSDDVSNQQMRRQSSAHYQYTLEIMTQRLTSLEDKMDALQGSRNDKIHSFDVDEIKKRIAIVEDKLTDVCNVATVGETIVRNQQIVSEAPEEIKSTDAASGMAPWNQDEGDLSYLQQLNIDHEREIKTLNNLVQNLGKDKADKSTLDLLDSKLSQYMSLNITQQTTQNEPRTNESAKDMASKFDKTEEAVSLEMKDKIENLQGNFEKLLQSLRCINPKEIEGLHAKVKKLTTSLQRLKQKIPERAEVRDIVPFGDHAMLSAKPVLGYKCMACDRPLERLDTGQGRYLPVNALLPSKPKTSIDHAEDSDRSVARHSTSALNNQQINFGPILPKGGWKTHGNYRMKLKTKRRSEVLTPRTPSAQNQNHESCETP